MKTIFDPVNRWLSAAPLTLAAGNKRPVALDDTLDVLKDSAAVTVDVLANDFDPEGAPLTLVSASAALGTAVAEADDTVTYTPPPGISGFDTIVYEIADELDQRQTGQVNVTIREPELTIDVAPDNTLVVNAETGLIDITVTQPAEFAGTYQADTNDLTGGPINLVLPVVTGEVTDGETLSAADGLWIYDTGAGIPTQSWQWLRNGIDISGATAASYIAQAADEGQEISARETLSDAYGQRNATSATIGGAFTPANDPSVIGWWDATDAGTITDSAGLVSTWADKTVGTTLAYAPGSGQPVTNSRTLNGLNVLDFDGSSLLEGAISLPASGDVAFHMALVIDSTSNAFEALLAVEATNDFQIDANNAAQFDGRLNAAGIGSATTLSGGPFLGGLILSAVFDRTGTGQAEVFITNVSRASMGYSAAIDSAVALHLMTNRSKNAWVNGAVAELIVTGDVGNRVDHHQYLAAKWGLV